MAEAVTIAYVVLLAGTNNIGNGDSLSHIKGKTRGILQGNKICFLCCHTDPQPPTNVSIDKLNSDLQVLCQQPRVVFVDNNTDSTYQMPATYRLSNRDGLHLNTPGRKALSVCGSFGNPMSTCASTSSTS